MANSFLSSDAFLAPFQDKVVTRWCVALSGGLDSVALLHYVVTAKLPVVAIHVNHHLQVSAALFQQHCVDLCQRLQVPLQVIDIEVPKYVGDSVEATARQLRYEALFSCLNSDDVLLTAHHADDQAETVLLQLLRGAGPKGLAAMPRQIVTASNVSHYRPFLTMTRADIEAYIQLHHLTYIEDVSNSNEAFDRNYLRHQVMPLLRQRWPSCAKTLSRSASLSAEMIQWAVPLWQRALKHCQDGTCLDLTKLAALSSYECSEVVRLWLEEKGLPLPSLTHMQQVCTLIYQRRSDSHASVMWSHVIIRAYQNRLYALSHEDIAPRVGVFVWPEQEDKLEINELTLRREWILGQGLVLTHQHDCEVRFRSQGERFHAAGRVGSHPLKKLFQEWGVPPWLRGRIPLIYSQGELVAVVGYAYHAKKLAAKDQLGVVFFE